MNRNIETFIGCDNEYDEAKMVIFGAPFDSTTSFRPGTRFASKAMRSESFGIETYSIYQNKDLEDMSIFDGGDLELPFGNPQKALDQIEEFASEIINDDKVPCMIGGEHLVTLGSVRAVAKKYPDLHIIHFDAHADLRDSYLGETLSHASVMHRVWDIVGDNKIFQFGIRSGDREEIYWGKDHVYTSKFNFTGLEEVIEKLKGKPVYFTIDLDVLDPSVFPGTGTPEAGGVTFMQLLGAILKVSKLNIVGMDVNELSPIYDQSGSSTALACKVLRELLLSTYKA
ncbi:agmatinase [Clostridium saccharobutylicum]|uniref:Agmatinase SpeB n=1 Tax=Clostridium saccharobutylicum DSM 13864 TaxID=1345695 RepID=U5MR00_CLOSA|nr:agmatinase [Clostridium saccharobutylicum]AGX41862.1 agmatinase SpeB [Clostridium saccharobutylicum DSM 13864]AQR89136.1 agmatinase [Clostridium saccharobutylicum]AQR99037.1 agmatinase [Clostridium saccharobutylicum]AQS13025.1 agmatinase [Clostridium saccharobutylicum]MBA2903854.1 agmatinase [Clostridium saccharobutylicum]